MSPFRVVTRAPSVTGWTIDRTQQLATNNYQDLAIVARFFYANIGKVTTIIAEIGRGGAISGGVS